MDAAQSFFAALIALVLIGLGVYYGRQQGQSLRRLRGQDDLPPEERRFFRNQARVRLICCGLMLVLAGVVAGYYFGGLHDRANELQAFVQQKRERGEEVIYDAEQRRTQVIFAACWGTAVLLLLGIFCLAALDMFSIRRFGRQQLRQLQADRRAMLEEQLARYRSERNGGQ